LPFTGDAGFQVYSAAELLGWLDRLADSASPDAREGVRLVADALRDRRDV
jgi:hypothetical protein